MHDAHFWLQISLSLFFSFPAFYVCSAKLMWQKKKGGGEWEGRELGKREMYSTFFLSDRETIGFPAKTPQAIPARRTGDYITTLIPKRSRQDCHRPSSCTLCHLTLPSTSQEGGIFICISCFIYNQGSERWSELNQNSNAVLSDLLPWLLPEWLERHRRGCPPREKFPAVDFYQKVKAASGTMC